MVPMPQENCADGEVNVKKYYDVTPEELKSKFGISPDNYQEAYNICIKWIEIKRGKRGDNFQICKDIREMQKEGERFSEVLKRLHRR